MSIIEAIVLALIQGLTEFLPISSSAHLILPSQVLGWADQGLAFDVAVHVGTLLAVVLYFRQELLAMTVGWSKSLVTRQQNQDSRLAWAVILGTIPAGLAGLIFNDFIETNLRSALVIAIATLVFGGLLWLADLSGGGQRNEHQLTWKDVVVVGFAQMLALIPGTSRSGITMTAGLFTGLSREGAARFSFLLSIPLITAAGGLKLLELIELGETVDWLFISTGIVVSALSAYVCIHYFLILIQRMGLLPFVIYRLILGAVLLVYVL